MKKNFNYDLIFVLILFLYLVSGLLSQILLMYEENLLIFTIIKYVIFISVFIFGLFIYYRKMYTINSNILFFIILFFLIQLIMILYNYFFTTNTITIESLIEVITIVLFCIIFLGLFDKQQLKYKYLKIFLFLYIAFMLYACIFNIIYNFNNIINIFSLESAYERDFSSFFDGRNAFGLYLMYGIIANFILISLNEKKKWLHIIFIVIFLLNLILTFSRTMIGCTIIFIIIYYILTYFKNFKKMILFISLLTIILVIVLSVRPLYDFFVNIIIRKDVGLTGRDEIYSFAYNIYKNNNIIFGSGYEEYLIQLGTIRRTSTHNTILFLLITGGIISVLFFIFLLIYSISIIFKIRKYHKSLGNIFLVTTFCYFLASNFENIGLCFPYMSSYISTLFVLLIPKYLYNCLNKNGVVYAKQ